ncbi:MAG: IS21-like element helper ATPase IstB [Bacteroidales bacterium]|jgi:DNA replication protein DnaC
MNVSSEVIKMYAKQLRLPTIERYETVLRSAMDNNWGYEEFLAMLLKTELDQQQENRKQRRIKAAKFPQIKTLDSLDFSWIKNVDRSLVYELATGRFIDEKRPLIAFGNPGTGKTHMALGIAYEACCRGYKTRFYTAAELITDLGEASQQGSLSRLNKKLMSYDLLIIDELSYITFGRSSAELLFQALSNRHELGSVLITTNLPFSQWTELFGDSSLTAALVDRLAHKAIILNMNGNSYRLRDRMQLEENT